MTSHREARARVEALLAAASKTFGRGRDPALVHALAVESGLHVVNVTWALDHVLELSPAEDDVERLLERAPRHTGVIVLLAGNVFVAPLRAVAWALAQSSRVRVRTSRRAALFTRALFDAARGTAADFELVESGEPERDVLGAMAEWPDAAVHAYGGARTIDAVTAAAGDRALEAHGPGFGAMLAHSQAYLAHADPIARDVAVFDQRGCLSPRIALVVGGEEDRARVADALHAALSSVDAAMPRGDLDEAERSALVACRDAAIVAGRALEGEGHLVVESPVITMGPAARVLPVIAVEEGEAIAWLSQQRELACVATDRVLPLMGPRIATLGAMQRPRLDGPVDARVLGAAPRSAGDSSA